VRAQGGAARIEIALEELSRALEAGMAATIVARVKSAGFSDVNIDPAGYRQGSLNEALRHRAAP